MSAHYSLIKKYALLIAVVVTTTFSTVVAVLYFHFVQIDKLKVRAADFHLATIQASFRVKETLFQLGKLAEELQASAPRRGTEAGADDVTRQKLHYQSLIQFITPPLDSIDSLQRRFGGEQYEATVRRIAAQGEILTGSVAVPQLEQAEIAGILTAASALDLSLSQLGRLHAIAHDEATRRYDENTWLANVIIVPGAVILVLCGTITLRYFVRQIGAALQRQAAAETALSQLNAELESRVEERTAQLRSAEAELVRKERLAAIGQVTATVSHELRNPLGAIRSGIDAIRTLAKGGDSQMSRAVGIVDRSIGRCERIIAELLNFTRVQSIDWQATGVDDWLGEVIDEFELPDHITVERALASGAHCTLDRDRMRRAVLNVIQNSCQAMENGTADGEPAEPGRLSVTSRRAGGRLEIAIEDTGRGINVDDMPNVFEPLYSTKAFGVGLGLPVVRQILEQHGGGVDLSSRPGQGTQVVLWLPAHPIEQGASCDI